MRELIFKQQLYFTEIHLDHGKICKTSKAIFLDQYLKNIYSRLVLILVQALDFYMIFETHHILCIDSGGSFYTFYSTNVV